MRQYVSIVGCVVNVMAVSVLWAGGEIHLGKSCVESYNSGDVEGGALTQA